MTCTTWTACICLCLFLCVGCDEPEPGPPSDGGVVDAADSGDDGATPEDAAEPDTAADATPCSEKIVGRKCTKDGECGAGHTCLLFGGAGYCSCACTPDDPATNSTSEDTCPGTDLLCAPHGQQGSRCFRYLGNAAPDCADKYTHNWDTAYGFPYANMELARLTAPAPPFTVVGVRYLLGGTGTGGTSTPCDSTVPHRVDLWVGADTTPVASPKLAATLQAAVKTQGKVVAVSHTLKAAIQLKSGEHLFVAVELSNKVNGRAMCIATCGGGAAAGQRSYTSWESAYSVNNAPPYKWTSYSAMGTSQELGTLALGF